MQGATDLICNHNGMETVVDFKQSNRPKREEWIEDYYMQIAAYAMAHDYVYGSHIKQGVIMVCTPDLYYQEFKVEGLQLRKWKHAFLKRLDMYNELKNDEKEKAKVDTTALLKEFEEEKKIKTPSEQYQDELEPITPSEQYQSELEPITPITSPMSDE
jgi:hypothetical protein